MKLFEQITIQVPVGKEPCVVRAGRAEPAQAAGTQQPLVAKRSNKEPLTFLKLLLIRAARLDKILSVSKQLGS